MTGEGPVDVVTETDGSTSSKSPPSPTLAGVKRHRHRHKLKHRYRFEKTLGKGTYGKVKLATEIHTGNQVAIKTIPKNKIDDPEDMRRIRQEIELMSTLDHPNIVNIYEVFESKEKIVIVMEYASGGELYEYIDRNSISVEEVQRLFRQIISALAYCHLNNIVHRDLKLENVLLDEMGNAKIADFGLSSYYSDNSLLHTFCGSPLYASPEIVSGQPYHGPEVDCWSLGVILYAMVYKTMPFGGDDFNQLKRQIVEGYYYDPCPGTVPSQLIRHLLTINPRHRATIYDVARNPWVFGDEVEDILCRDLLSNEEELAMDAWRDRDSTGSSDTESEEKQEPTERKPKGILKGNSQDDDVQELDSDHKTEQSLDAQKSLPKDSQMESGSDAPSHLIRADGRNILEKQGDAIQNETDSFLSLASSTATLPSSSCSAISDDVAAVESGLSSAPKNVVKRRADSGKKIQRPATIGAVCHDLPSPMTLIKQLAGTDNAFEYSMEEKRASARLSKRISCGKYSKVTELWESIFSETHMQALIGTAASKTKSTNSETTTGESSSSSSSEDLLDLLNCKQLKKSCSSSFRQVRHRLSSHRRSMRTHKEMVIMEAQQLMTDSRIEKIGANKSTRDSGLGDDLDSLAKVYQKALDISSGLQ